MLNALIQLGTFAYGMAINFLAPLLFGLDAYGTFIAYTALVFLLHRALIILSEPLISFTKPRWLLAQSLLLCTLAFALCALVDRWFPLGSLLLLAGLLLNVSVLISMQAMRRRRAYIVVVAMQSVLFIGAMLAARYGDAAITLVQAMELSSILPSVVGILYLSLRGAAMPRAREVRATFYELLAHVPRMVSITAVMNLLTSALPVFLVPVLGVRELGLFKVMVSIVQATTAVFPASTQALLTNFVHHPRGAEFYRLLIGIAMLYFAAAAMGLVTVALLFPVLAPYVMLAACLPAYFHTVLAERHMTATAKLRPLIAINLLLSLGILAATLTLTHVEDAALLYATGFTLYSLALGIAEPATRTQPLLLITLASGPLYVYAMHRHLWLGLLYGALVMLATLLRHRPTLAEVKLLWREL